MKMKLNLGLVPIGLQTTGSRTNFLTQIIPKSLHQDSWTDEGVPCRDCLLYCNSCTNLFH